MLKVKGAVQLLIGNYT